MILIWQPDIEAVAKALDPSAFSGDMRQEDAAYRQYIFARRRDARRKARIAAETLQKRGWKGIG